MQPDMVKMFHFLSDSQWDAALSLAFEVNLLSQFYYTFEMILLRSVQAVRLHRCQYGTITVNNVSMYTDFGPEMQMNVFRTELKILRITSL